MAALFENNIINEHQYINSEYQIQRCINALMIFLEYEQTCEDIGEWISWYTIVGVAIPISEILENIYNEINMRQTLLHPSNIKFSLEHVSVLMKIYK